MANQKISQMPSLTASELAAGDLLAVVDVSDVTQASSGSNKKITVTELQSAAVSAGTANGVLYLNGSKQATSGSALTFDGSNLGLGVTPGAWVGDKALQVNSGSISSGYEYSVSVSSVAYRDNATWKYLVTSQAPALYEQINSAHKWFTAPSGTAGDAISFTQAMTLNAGGNLGVGTSSPAAKLHITGSNEALRLDADFGLIKGYGADSTTLTGFLQFNKSSDVILSAEQAIPLIFKTSATERARIDSAGNLGLGVTPSAWDSSIKALEVNGLSIAAQGHGGGVWQSSNAYVASGGAYKYIASARALQYQMDAPTGSHKWFTAPSGTAGNAISFTQAMTLDASGRLYVGPTSASQVGNARFAVTGGAAYDGQFDLIAQLTNDTTNAAKGVLIGYNNYSNTGIIASAYGNGTESLAFWTHNGTAWGERARIGSSGDLLVGTPSASVTNGGLMSAINGGSSYLSIGHVVGTPSTVWFASFELAGIGIGNITQAGTTSVSYNTSSDYRLKTITGPITNSGAYIDSLNPVEGTWKADGSTFVGLIAHEVQEVSRTQVATGEKDGDQMQAMDYSNSELIANLIAEVKSLRARVAALESN